MSGGLKHSDEWGLYRNGNFMKARSLNIVLHDIGQDLVIGRHKECRITLASRLVSRQHAFLRKNGSHWCIVDLKSLNGIYVNGDRIAPSVPYVLKEGDRIGIGVPECEADDHYEFILYKKVKLAKVKSEKQQQAVLGSSQVFSHNNKTSASVDDVIDESVTELPKKKVDVETGEDLVTRSSSCSAANENVKQSSDTSQALASKSTNGADKTACFKNTLCDADSSQEISSSVKEELVFTDDEDDDKPVSIKQENDSEVGLAQIDDSGPHRTSSISGSPDNALSEPDADKVSCNEVSSSSSFLPVPSCPKIPETVLAPCYIVLMRCDSPEFMLPVGLSLSPATSSVMKNVSLGDNRASVVPRKRTLKRKSSGSGSSTPKRNRRQNYRRISFPVSSVDTNDEDSSNQGDNSDDSDVVVVGTKKAIRKRSALKSTEDVCTSNFAVLRPEQIKTEKVDTTVDTTEMTSNRNTEQLETKVKIESNVDGYTQDDELIVISDDESNFVCSSSTVIKTEPGLPDLEDSVVNDYLPHSLGFELAAEDLAFDAPLEDEAAKARGENEESKDTKDQKQDDGDLGDALGKLSEHLEDISSDDEVVNNEADYADDGYQDFFPILSQNFFSDGEQSQEDNASKQNDVSASENYTVVSFKPPKHRSSHATKKIEMIEPLPITYRPRKERGREEWFEERSTSGHARNKLSKKESCVRSALMDSKSKCQRKDLSSNRTKSKCSKSLKEKIKEQMNHRIPAPGGGSAIPVISSDRSLRSLSSRDLSHQNSLASPLPHNSSNDQQVHLSNNRSIEPARRFGEPITIGKTAQRFTSRMEILTKSMSSEVKEKSKPISETLKSYKIPKRISSVSSESSVDKRGKSEKMALPPRPQTSSHFTDKEKLGNTATGNSAQAGQSFHEEEKPFEHREVRFRNYVGSAPDSRTSSLTTHHDNPLRRNSNSSDFPSLTGGPILPVDPVTRAGSPVNNWTKSKPSPSGRETNGTRNSISAGGEDVICNVGDPHHANTGNVSPCGIPIPTIETRTPIKSILKKSTSMVPSTDSGNLPHAVGSEQHFVMSPRPSFQDLPDLTRISINNIDIEACLRSVAQLSAVNSLGHFQGNPSFPNVMHEPQPSDPRIQPRKYSLVQLHSSTPGAEATLPPITKPSRTMNTDKILSNILSWKVQWLKQQTTQTLPPPVVEPKAVVETKLSYDSFDEYMNTYLPLLFLETWEAIYQSWRECCSRSSMSCPLAILSSDPKEELCILSCEALVPLADRMQDNFPQEGHLLIMDLRINGMDNNSGYRVFGYVQSSKLEGIKHGIGPNHPELRKNLPKSEDVCLLTLQVAAKRKYANVNTERVNNSHVACYLKPIIRQYEAVLNLHAYPLVRDILRPRTTNCRIPLLLPSNSAARFTGSYNSCQIKAILGTAAAMCRPYPIPQIALIQGPPGTGKTHVLIGIVEHLVMSDPENSQQPIKLLVTAPSNAAVDEITRRLVILKQNLQVMGIKRKIRFVRVGQPSQIHPDVRRYWLDDLVMKNLQDQDRDELEKKKLDISQLEARINSLEHSLDARRTRGASSKDIEKIETQLSNAHKTLQILQKERALLKNLSDQELDRRKRQMRNDILQNANVILSTLNSCRQVAMESAFRGANTPHISCCIVDEASQCTEPELLIPLVYGMCKMVLIGDPRQLPATVCSHVAMQKNFQRSLMERFWMYFGSAGENPTYVLNEQYRMHPDICHFPSAHFYSGALFTSHALADRDASFPLQPYLLFNIQEGRESTNEPSNIYNMQEALMVVRIVMITSQVAPTGTRINVITPYQGQRRLFEDLLRKEKLSEVEVSTVDSFQGQESDVIVFSCVRAKNASGNIGFVANPQRLNVAITRAKHALYICGHLASLKVNVHWEKLLQNAAERKSIRSVSSDTPLQELKRIVTR